MSPDSKILKAKRLEIAIAGTGLGIWELDVTNGENYTNDEWWEMLGYRKGEHDYSMDFFLSLLHPEDRYIPIETMN